MTAQSTSKDSKYNLYYRDLNKSRIRSSEEIIKYGDSLKNLAQQPIDIIYSNFILSNGYLNRNDLDKALIYVNEALILAEDNRLGKEKLKALFHIKDIYKKMNLLDKFEETVMEIRKDLDKFSKNENLKTYVHLKSDNLLDLGTLNLSKNPSLTEKYYKEALNLVSTQNSSSTGLYRIYINFGNFYTQQKDHLKAIDNYQKLLELNKKNGNILSYQIVGQANLAINYIALKDFEKAKNALDTADNLIKQYNLKTYELELKYIYSDYYKAVGNDKKENEVNRELLAITKNTETESQQAISKMIDLTKQNTEHKHEKIVVKQKKRINYLTFALVLTLFLFVILTYIYKKKKDQHQKYYEALLNKLKSQNYNIVTEAVAAKINTTEDTSVEERNTVGISEEKEQEILEKILEFESTEQFTDNTMSLPILASYCKTNTKYLTYIIKKHRELTYTDYINKLRINYITKRIYNEPELIRFKINYLAELAGYSSHSRFAMIFKKENNVSPSDFIEKLKKTKH